MDSSAGAWSEAAGYGSPVTACPAWRAYCDLLHERLIAEWVGASRFDRSLKTDLFDEVVGPGLVRVLQRSSREVHGLDLVESLVLAATAANPGLLGRCADVRQTGLADGSMDFVLSNSTLDHFREAADLPRTLRELARVLRAGGLLLVTLDNPQNPLVGLRNALPYAALRKTGLVPYFVGHTVPMDTLAGMLEDCSLRLLRRRHIMHVPRVVALHLCRLCGRNRQVSSVLLRAMLAGERAAGWPAAQITGHFSAVLARKNG
jgi:SAM-dependent methyltransferase